MNHPATDSDPTATPRIQVDEATSSHPALDDRPRLWNPYYHLIRQLNASLRRALETVALPAGAKVLDYGCSTMRYRPLFPRGVEYLGADLPGNSLAHVILENDGRVPQADGSFDLVLSTQVLEHVEDPALYLAECRRLLKPGGQMILSTHGTFIFHPCPYDYWRWTSDGLQKAIRDAGFEITGMQGLCGGIPTALQLMQDLISPRTPRLLKPVLHLIFQAAMVLTDRLYAPSQRLRNACILMVTARASSGR
jgi:SAM-dependent methyltransferase